MRGLAAADCKCQVSFYAFSVYCTCVAFCTAWQVYCNYFRFGFVYSCKNFCCAVICFSFKAKAKYTVDYNVSILDDFTGFFLICQPIGDRYTVHSAIHCNSVISNGLTAGENYADIISF